jgi:hypothetical protein
MQITLLLYLPTYNIHKLVIVQLSIGHRGDISTAWAVAPTRPHCFAVPKIGSNTHNPPPPRES